MKETLFVYEFCLDFSLDFETAYTMLAARPPQMIATPIIIITIADTDI